MVSASVASSCGVKRAAHIGQRGKGGDDQADTGEVTFLRSPPSSFQVVRIDSESLPTGIEIPSAGHSSMPTALTVSYSAASSPGFAASRHPVGGQLDAGQLERRGQQVGDGFGHRHAARRGRVQRGQRRALAHAHGFAGKAFVIGQRHGAIGHRHLPRADHRVAVGEAAHGAVANGDEEALAGHGRVRQHVDDGFLQVHAGQVQGGNLAFDGFDVAVSFWAVCLASTFIGISTGDSFALVGQNELLLVRRHAHDGKRTALALTNRLERVQRLGRNRHDVAFLALVAPDFLGCQAGFFQRHGAQVKACATAGVVDQFGEGVGQTARAHVVNRQNRVVRARLPALVDDFLRTALDFGVAALHRVKVQRGGVGAGRHRAGRAAAHADTHAGAAELDQQAACGEEDFVGQVAVDHAQAACDHDGLVVAALHGVDAAGDGLLVLAEVAQQIRATKLVVERRAAQRAFDHDLQRAGDVFGFAVSI